MKTDVQVGPMKFTLQLFNKYSLSVDVTYTLPMSSPEVLPQTQKGFGFL